MCIGDKGVADNEEKKMKNPMKLTALEVIMLHAIRDEECCNGEPLNGTWNQSAMLDFVQLGGKRPQAGGVVASLVEKKLVWTHGTGKDDGIGVTKLGLETINAYDAEEAAEAEEQQDARCDEANAFIASDC